MSPSQVLSNSAKLFEGWDQRSDVRKHSVRPFKVWPRANLTACSKRAAKPNSGRVSKD